MATLIARSLFLRRGLRTGAPRSQRAAKALFGALQKALVAQRAARTFSVERGEFVVRDATTLQVVAGTALDIRTVIYLGAKSNLSEQRLSTELAQLGHGSRSSRTRCRISRCTGSPTPRGRS